MNAAGRTQSDFLQAEDQDGQQDKNDSDVESEVDPEDPLYGLNQRLKNMNLDEESMRIIKEKLLEANDRVKQALEDRQKNLDSKMAGDKNAPKKK